jgi:hypothetical protein
MYVRAVTGKAHRTILARNAVDSTLNVITIGEHRDRGVWVPHMRVLIDVECLVTDAWNLEDVGW